MGLQKKFDFPERTCFDMYWRLCKETDSDLWVELDLSAVASNFDSISWKKDFVKGHFAVSYFLLNLKW